MTSQVQSAKCSGKDGANAGFLPTAVSFVRIMDRIEPLLCWYRGSEMFSQIFNLVYIFFPGLEVYYWGSL